jgi:methionyl-tRNA formyltransferase
VRFWSSLLLPDESFNSTDEPGTIAAVERDRIVVTTGSGWLAITELQPDGRPAMTAADFINGYQVRSGARFGPIPGT